MIMHIQSVVLNFSHAACSHGCCESGTPECRLHESRAAGKQIFASHIILQIRRENSHIRNVHHILKVNIGLDGNGAKRKKDACKLLQKITNGS